jgi:hypothetical protein
MASEVMTAAAHGVASKSMSMEGVSRCAVSAQCMTTPPMTKVGRATMGGKSMKPTASAMPATTPAVKPSKPSASAVKTASTASTMKAATTTSATMPTPTTAMPGDCRNVRLDAKRANRNARCQNAYYFLLHDAFPNRSPKPACNAREPAYLYLTAVSAPSF